MEILQIYFNQSRGARKLFQNLLIRRKKDESRLKWDADIVRFLEMSFHKICN